MPWGGLLMSAVWSKLKTIVTRSWLTEQGTSQGEWNVTTTTLYSRDSRCSRPSAWELLLPPPRITLPTRKSQPPVVARHANKQAVSEVGAQRSSENGGGEGWTATRCGSDDTTGGLQVRKFVK